MKKNRRTVLIIVAVLMAMLTGVIIANAAPSNTRGRVAVDISNFTYVDHDGGRSRGLSNEGNGTKYKLYYENYMISDHDNDGVTYRSSKTYDMTDVVKLEFSAYTQTDHSDKFMIYTTTSDYKTFHGKDRSDIKDSMYNGQDPAVSGKVYSFSSFAKQISKNIYSTDFQYRSFNTDNTYEDRYVYIAMSKDYPWSKQGIMLQNNTYSQKVDGTPVSGGINLLLKEHKVQLLAPDKPKRIDIDNSEVTNTTAYSDLEMKMNDGDSYAPGKKASLYRDEEIVMSYKWGAGVNGKVIGYNFYADSEKKTRLYQLNTTSGTIKFNADLIQKIETASGKDLGDFYLEPIFQYDQATIEVSDSVAETDNLVIKQSASNAYDYLVIDKTAGNATVGTIHLNKAKYVGDYLRIDYEANASYQGDYAISSFLLALCETAEQVNTTTNTAFFEPSATAVDYNQQIENKYIRILPRIKLNATVTLEDKTVTFSNSKVEIDPAEVTYPDGAIRPPGANKISYQYYTDENCKNIMDDYPMNAGTYYVIATMPGDTDYYGKAVSNKAKLTIKKAVPILENIRGRQAITYGQDLTKTAGITGTAKGVGGNHVTGDFAWADPSQKLDAGYKMAEVKFTPTGAFATNYTEAAGDGLVTVKADAVIVSVAERTHVYNGEAPAPNHVTVTGKTSGETTGQSVKMDYYKDAACKTKINAPIYAGTYYVKASVSAKGNYNSGSGIGKATINKARINLVQVPYKDQTMTKAEYRVYLQGAQVKPLGTVTLDIDYQSSHRQLTSAEMRKDEENRFYAAFDVDAIKNGILAGEYVELVANYVCSTGYEDYEALPAKQQFFEGHLAETFKKKITYGDQTTHKYSWKDEEPFAPTGLVPSDKVKFQTFVTDSDVAEITLDNKGAYNERVNVKAENAGSTYVLTYFTWDHDVSGTDSYFLMYEIVVEKADVTVTLPGDKTVVYDGYPVTIDEAAVTGVNIPQDGPLPDDMYVSYNYYSDAACTNKRLEPPTEPGTYYVVAETNETRNYNAGTSNKVKLTIEKAPAEISLQSKMVTYDGNPHKLDDAVLQGSVSAIPEDGEEFDENINTDAALMPVTGDVTYVYKDRAGNIVPDADQMTKAGLYTVTASLTDDPIYKDVTSEPAYLLIVPEYAKLTISNVEKTYDGLPAEPEITFTVDGESIPVPEEVYVEYCLKILAGNNVKTGLPTEAGNYHTRASIDRGNYWSSFSELGEIIIHRAEVKVVIPQGYEAEYNGSPVTFDNAKVTFGETDITNKVNLTYEYYGDEACETVIEPPQYPETYYVKAFSTGTRNFKPGESEAQKIVIKKRPVYLSDLEISSEAAVTGKAKNKEGADVSGSFHIIDMESFWNLPVGTHQVEVEFVPDAEASRIYDGATGFAAYTVIPPEHELTIEDLEKTYDGEPAEITMHFTVEGETAAVPEETHTKYILKFHDEGTAYSDGVPTDAGQYVIYGTIDEGTYKDTYSNLGEILIHQAELDIRIPEGYEAEYTGTAVQVDTAIVTFGDQDVTKDFDVNYVYYSDQSCKTEIEAPVSPGIYYAKAFVDETRNFKAAVSEPVKITIKGSDGNDDPSGDKDPTDGNDDPSSDKDSDGSNDPAGDNDGDGNQDGNGSDGNQDEDGSQDGGNPEGNASDDDQDKDRDGIPDSQESPITGDQNPIGGYLMLTGIALLVLMRCRKQER